MLNVYSIVPAEPSALPEGTRAVRCGGLVAIVRDVEAAPALGRDAVLAHDAVVGALVDRCDAVLPVRFGTVLDDAGAVEDLVLSRLRSIRAALDLVSGARQMTLRVLGASSVAAGGSPSVAGAGEGARYLRARVASAARARDVPELAPLRPALVPLVRAERVQRHDRPPLLASVYHLVPTPEVERYREVVARSAEHLGAFRLRVSGPWPAYAFGDEG